MKKLYSCLVALVLSASMSFAQPINDQVVIPIGVTINSITRMSVVSGGNIEFVFSSLADYTNGITGYSTVIQLASSEVVTVRLLADGPFTGDATSNPLIADAVEFQCNTVSALSNITADLGVATYVPVPTVAPAIDVAATAAGLVANGTFTIDWQCGVTVPVAGEAADRYAANIIITAAP